MGIFNHSGNLVTSLFFPSGPTRAVRSSRASSRKTERSPCDDGRDTKSAKSGPALILLVKEVADRLGRGLVVGSGAAVAKDRERNVVGGRTTLFARSEGEDIMLGHLAGMVAMLTFLKEGQW